MICVMSFRSLFMIWFFLLYILRFAILGWDKILGHPWHLTLRTFHWYYALILPTISSYQIDSEKWKYLALVSEYNSITTSIVAVEWVTHVLSFSFGILQYVRICSSIKCFLISPTNVICLFLLLFYKVFLFGPQ
jgi:hypothetical protein